MSSIYFTIFNGVKQGGVMSPICFSLYIDPLLEYLRISGYGCQLVKYTEFASVLYTMAHTHGNLVIVDMTKFVSQGILLLDYSWFTIQCTHFFIRSLYGINRYPRTTIYS